MAGVLRVRANLLRSGSFVGVVGLLLVLVACGGGDTDTVADAEKKQQQAALARPGITLAQQLRQRLAPEDLSTERGPVDYGRGAPPLVGTREVLASQSKLQAAAVAASAPHITGQFTDAFPWPLIPLHAVLLPDGRVMSYGTNELGDQGGQFNYAIWDPSLGTGTDAHLLLPNTATTDIFCTGQIVVPRTGEVIMTGGDRTINGVRNYSINDVTFFDYLTNKIRAATQKMAQPRWYPTVTTLLDGTVLVLGGRDDLPVTTAIATPELFNPDTGWRSLTGATNDVAYGTANWWYPRAWTTSNGQVFVATNVGRTFMVNAAGTGAIAEQSLNLLAGDYWFPDVMFAPGKVLSVRSAAQAQVIDLTGAQPTATATSNLSQVRIWSSATVLADGRVLVSGGSSSENQALGVAYQAEIWNPATGTWTIGASATRMRLYHSTAMLLPDGRVLTAGGGAPGPVTNLNAEIYEPPYLFKADGSGEYAARPAIQSAPLQIGWGASFNVQTDGSPISKLAFIRTGSVTHSVDFDQRYSELAFTQNGGVLTVQAPASAGAAPPGNYLLFAFNSAGVPSPAKIIRVAPVNEVYPNSLTVRARATLAGGIGATMEVRIADTVVATTQVTNTVYQDFVYPLAGVTPGGAKVEIVYTNDGTVGAENRDLFVESVTLNRTTVVPTGAGVVFDRGSGPAAFDNADVVSGTTDLTTNGALRFSAPGALSSTVTIRANADIAENVGPIMRVLVDGNLAASVEIRNTVYQDYTLRLPMLVNPGARVDLVYANDGSVTGDRNLYVESLGVNGNTILATAPGVTVDRGSGAAAFDGIDVLPGQSAIYWNAALRFTAPAATPALTVRARASLAGNVGPLMQVLVNGVSIGSTEVRSTSFTD